MITYYQKKPIELASGVSAQLKQPITASRQVFASSQVHSSSGFSPTLTIIDTPGLADTKGIDQDDINLNLISEAAKSVPAPGLHAICVIASGRNARWTVNEQTVYGKLKAFLPNRFQNNVILVLTKCLTQSDSDFPLKIFKEFTKISPRYIFYMDNSAFAPMPEDLSSEDQELAKQTRSTSWDVSMNKLVNIVNEVNKMIPQETSDFEKMRQLRFVIKTKLNNSKLEIINLQKIQEQLDAADKMVKEHGANAAAFANFTQQEEIKKVEQVPSAHHNTLCSNCNHVCHDHCALSEISNKGDNAFTSCAAFEGEQCIYCPGKCSYLFHLHGRYAFKETTETIEKVLHDMKKKYEDAQAGLASGQQALTAQQSARQVLKLAITQLQNTIQEDCQQLRGLCDGFNFVDELFITLKQLEAESKVITSLEARQTIETFILFLKALITHFKN